MNVNLTWTETVSMVEACRSTAEQKEAMAALAQTTAEEKASLLAQAAKLRDVVEKVESQ